MLIPYYRARIYSPQIGRFISRDPIGVAGGMNLFAYCGGNPVNRLDPRGWDSVTTSADGTTSITVEGADTWANSQPSLTVNSPSGSGPTSEANPPQPPPLDPNSNLTYACPGCYNDPTAFPLPDSPNSSSSSSSGNQSSSGGSPSGSGGTSSGGDGTYGGSSSLLGDQFSSNPGSYAGSLSAVPCPYANVGQPTDSGKQGYDPADAVGWAGIASLGIEHSGSSVSLATNWSGSIYSIFNGNQYVKVVKLVEVARVAGPVLGFLGVIIDLNKARTGNLGYNHLAANSVVALIGGFTGLPGGVVAGAYFGIDTYYPHAEGGSGFKTYVQALESKL